MQLDNPDIVVVPFLCPECRQEMLLHCARPRGDLRWSASIDCPYCGDGVDPEVTSEILAVTRKPTGRT